MDAPRPDPVLLPVDAPSKLRILDRTNATTSSITAAPRSAVPSFVCWRETPVVWDPSTARTVPSDVEHNAAPLAKACSGGKPKNGVSRKERAIGARIPVSAMVIDKGNNLVSVGSEVVIPPGS
jgi:hypothetical protein